MRRAAMRLLTHKELTLSAQGSPCGCWRITHCCWLPSGRLQPGQPCVLGYCCYLMDCRRGGMPRRHANGHGQANSWRGVALRRLTSVGLANGQSTASRCVGSSTLEAERVRAVEMPDSPALLPLSRRCVNRGCSFGGGRIPLFLRRAPRRVTCVWCSAHVGFQHRCGVAP